MYSKFLVGMGLAAAMLVSAPTFAADLVVFSSTGLNLAPGQSIDGSKVLKLGDGQKVTLVTANGTILNLAGPYAQVPSAQKAGDEGRLSAALNGMMKLNQHSTSALGVMRDTTKSIKVADKQGWVPHPWVIDVTRSGNYCSPESQPAMFWRPDHDKTSIIKISMVNSNWKGYTEWVAGSDKIAPASNMPLRDGSIYNVDLDGTTSSITLHLIPRSLSSLQMQAAWMNEKGCTAQTLAMLRTM
ncbi:MAG: hypothetical protein HQL70_04895 [Magnetococcales bacterium]|nr:hypothetical protein [Magnetococcales bacterium]